MFYCVSPYYAFGGIVKDAFIHPAIDGSNPVGTGAFVQAVYYNRGFVTIGEGNRKCGFYVSELTEHLRIGGLSPSFRVIQRIYGVLCREWVGNWGDTYWNSFHVW